MQKIELADGAAIYADMIAARRTYLGLIEGIPNDRMNERMIDGLKIMCKRAFCHDRFVVLPPVMTPREFNGKSWKALPACAIGGLFRSIRTVRDHSKTYSLLAILWFQESFDPLISPQALALMQQLDWAQLAEDVDD
jgi:hypothetical protein